MKKLSFLADDIRLSFHWHYIGKLRIHVKTMVNKGADCSNPELVRCSNRILSHGMAVSRIWQRQKQHNLHHLDTDIYDTEQTDTHAFTA